MRGTQLSEKGLSHSRRPREHEHGLRPPSLDVGRRHHLGVEQAFDECVDRVVLAEHLGHQFGAQPPQTLGQFLQPGCLGVTLVPRRQKPANSLRGHRALVEHGASFPRCGHRTHQVTHVDQPGTPPVGLFFGQQLCRAEQRPNRLGEWELFPTGRRLRPFRASLSKLLQLDVETLAQKHAGLWLAHHGCHERRKIQYG
ncbi:MAG: hypothetical protein LC130_11440 [Bryobacterales bacterium]|nr:hypothetical protein [Bryobacterales bacterium]